jgi:hypothetical protein
MGFRSDLGCSVAINKAKSVEASAGVLLHSSRRFIDFMITQRLV